MLYLSGTGVFVDWEEDRKSWEGTDPVTIWTAFETPANKNSHKALAHSHYQLGRMWTIVLRPWKHPRQTMNTNSSQKTGKNKQGMFWSRLLHSALTDCLTFVHNKYRFNLISKLHSSKRAWRSHVPWEKNMPPHWHSFMFLHTPISLVTRMTMMRPSADDSLLPQWVDGWRVEMAKWIGKVQEAEEAEKLEEWDTLLQALESHHSTAFKFITLNNLFGGTTYKPVHPSRTIKDHWRGGGGGGDGRGDGRCSGGWQAGWWGHQDQLRQWVTLTYIWTF